MSATTKIEIRGEDRVTPELKKIQNQLESMNRMNFTKFAASFDAISLAVGQVTSAVGKAVSAAREMIDVYAEQAKAETRLSSVLRATGNQMNISMKYLKDYASQMQNLTGFGDEAVMSAQQMLIATQSLSKDGLERALEASADLAAAMGTDIASAAQKMALALQSPSDGLRTLRTANIMFTDAEKEQIRTLQDAGELYEAQAVILDKVEKAYKGIAKDIADTDVGVLTKIGNTLGDIKEDLGKGILDAVSPALESILTKLQRVEAWASRNNKISDMRSDIWSVTDYDSLIDFANIYGADETNRFLDTVLNSDIYAGYRNGANPLLLRMFRETRLTDEAIAKSLESRGRWSLLSGATEELPVFEGEKADPLAGLLSRSLTARKLELTSQIGLLTGIYQDLPEGYDKTVYSEVIKSLREELESLGPPKPDEWKEFQNTLEGVLDSVDSLASGISDMFRTQSDALRTHMEQMRREGKLTLEQEEETQKKMSDLQRKAFYAEKANNLAQATSSYALGVMDIWKEHAGNPVLGGVLTGLLSATFGTQLASISSQSFTPSYAVGAYELPQDQIAQVHKGEMIIPKPFADEVRSGKGIGGTTIVFNVQGNADYDTVYRAIERAQHDGYLPRWSYV